MGHKYLLPSGPNRVTFHILLTSFLRNQEVVVLWLARENNEDGGRNHSEKSDESCGYLSGKCLLHPNICQEQQYETPYSKIKACKPCELFKSNLPHQRRTCSQCHTMVSHLLPTPYLTSMSLDEQLKNPAAGKSLLADA